MRFWDASAIVPLLLEEESSARVAALLSADREMTVWWVTQLECVSALRSAERANRLDQQGLLTALEILDDLSARWSEVSPSESIRWGARRLLLVHALRTADALQLAAALSISGERGEGPEFVALDERLRDAAAREGLRVVPARSELPPR